MGKQFEEATGKNFIAVESQSAEGMMIRLFQSLMWQRGVDVLSADGTTAAINSPEGVEVAALIKSIYDEGPGRHQRSTIRAPSRRFLNGDAGIIINGTWVVDSYNAQADSGKSASRTTRRQRPRPTGQRAVWADSHMWVVPRTSPRPRRSSTLRSTSSSSSTTTTSNGRGPATSRCASPSSTARVRGPAAPRELREHLAHRPRRAADAEPARRLQRDESDFNAMWLGGTEPQAALDAAQANVERILRRNRG
jgi:multiple sugar transport system substrate-binding protein